MLEIRACIWEAGCWADTTCLSVHLVVNCGVEPNPEHLIARLVQRCAQHVWLFDQFMSCTFTQYYLLFWLRVEGQCGSYSIYPYRSLHKLPSIAQALATWPSSSHTECLIILYTICLVGAMVLVGLVMRWCSWGMACFPPFNTCTVCLNALLLSPQMAPNYTAFLPKCLHNKYN